DLLAEYSTPKQTIGRGSFQGLITDQSPPAGDRVEDSTIQNELVRLLRRNMLPPKQDDGLYIVHFPPGVTVVTHATTSSADFCASHGTFKRNGNFVPYVVIPDMGGECADSCGGGDAFAKTTWVASHELVQAVTDPGIGFAPSGDDASPMAWFDPAVGEIADAC